MWERTNPEEIDGVVSSIVYEGLMNFFDGNPSIAKRVIERLDVKQKVYAETEQAADPRHAQGENRISASRGTVSDCSGARMGTATLTSWPTVQS